MPAYGEIIGHDRIRENLKEALRSGKISHAYILNGPELSGKTMLAEAFAAALTCEHPTAEGEACGCCRSCRQAKSRNHPDIIYVQQEKPAVISVDDIRKQLTADIVIRPYSGHRKVYIVDRAEKMNPQAQNALLKTIEEPPEYAVILLLTTNADSFLQTILSRCIQLNLKPVRETLIRDCLMKTRQIPDYKAEVCAAFSQGNVGKAIQLASSDEFNEMKNTVFSLMEKMEDLPLYELGNAVKKLAVYKERTGDLLDLLTIWFRDVLYFKASGDSDGLICRDQIYEVKKQAARHGYRGIEKIFEAIEQAGTRITANVNYDLTLELLLMAIREN